MGYLNPEYKIFDSEWLQGNYAKLFSKNRCLYLQTTMTSSDIRIVYLHFYLSHNCLRRFKFFPVHIKEKHVLTAAGTALCPILLTSQSMYKWVKTLLKYKFWIYKRNSQLFSFRFSCFRRYEYTHTHFTAVFFLTDCVCSWNFFMVFLKKRPLSTAM